jgi:hypothetical protein
MRHTLIGYGVFLAIALTELIILQILVKKENKK